MGLNFAAGLSGLMSGIQGMNTAGDLPSAPDNLYTHGQDANTAYWGLLNTMLGNSQRNVGMTDPNLVNAYQGLMGMDLSGLGRAGDLAGQQYGALASRAGQYGGLAQERSALDYRNQDQLRSHADTLRAQGANLYGQGDQLRGAGWDTYNLARDPQDALRLRTQQRLVEGTRAADSARGIAMSGASAGGEGSALSNFNIDWENQQLGRTLAGLQGLGGISSIANQTASVGNEANAAANQTNLAANQSGALGSQNLQNSMGYFGMQPGFTQQSATVPIQMRSQQYTLPMQWTNMFNQAQQQQNQPYANLAQGFGNYLGAAQQGRRQNWQDTTNYLMNYGGLRSGSYYGLAGGGGQGAFGLGGAGESGFGNPANWMGMGGMGG